jgi:hypothetical protein
MAAYNNKNHLWKGDKAGYTAIHQWVRRRKPKPLICENCALHYATQLANISGMYRRDINDFKWVCGSCNKLCFPTPHHRFFEWKRKKDKKYYDTHKARAKERAKNWKKTHKENMHLSYLRHKVHRLAKSRTWVGLHVEHVRAYQKQYRENHSEEKREQDRQYRELNKEKIREQGRLYRKNHAQEIKAKKRVFYQRNKEKILAQQKISRGG